MTQGFMQFDIWKLINPGQVNIQTDIRRQSESMVNRTRINSAHTIFFGI